ADGAKVDQGYAVRADAVDDLAVDHVELWINSKMVQSTTLPPYAFNEPADISPGRQRVEIRAYDTLGAIGKQAVEVTQGDRCHSADDCIGAGEVCVDGGCVPGPDQAGGLGATCEENQDCGSDLCGTGSDGKHCAELCSGAGTCPSGFGCLDVGDKSVCWAGY